MKKKIIFILLVLSIALVGFGCTENEADSYTGWYSEDQYYDQGVPVNCMWIKAKCSFVPDNDDQNDYYFYFDNKGIKVKNDWVKDFDGKYYHTDELGRMQINKWIDDKYYLCADGHMACNETISINGTSYNFDSNGEVIVPKQEITMSKEEIRKMLLDSSYRGFYVGAYENSLVEFSDSILKCILELEWSVEDNGYCNKFRYDTYNSMIGSKIEMMQAWVESETYSNVQNAKHNSEMLVKFSRDWGKRMYNLKSKCR